MSLWLNAPDPSSLLKRLKAAIDAGHITTWAYDRDGDFTHTPSQWVNRAWLQPHIMSNELVLTIVGQKAVPLDREAYAVYHGRFAEMMLAHFDQEFSSIRTSALATSGDRVSAS